MPPYLTSFSSHYTPLGSRHHSHLSDEPPEALRPSCLAKDTASKRGQGGGTGCVSSDMGIALSEPQFPDCKIGAIIITPKRISQVRWPQKVQ